MKNQKGITLIALIITIIVMLILVGVSVSVALNTGLFKSAQGAAKNTQAAADAETALSNGTIKIEGQEGEIDIDDYVASLKGEDGEGGNWELTTDADGNGEISVGDLVTYKEKTTEQFYVISVTGNTVAMLAKYNLKADGSSQDITGAINPCVFCSDTAWLGASAAEGDNLNEKQSIKADTTSALSKAITYGTSLGGTGRLMLESEANALKTANSTILSGRYEAEKYLYYWLASTDGYDLVNVVYVGLVSNHVFNFYGWDSSNPDYPEVAIIGVRPIVEILKSDI